MTPADLRAAGDAIYGPEWQRPLARALGMYHPGGARAGIDDRLVRRWLAGDRPIPEWVPAAIVAIARTVLPLEEKRVQRIREVIDMKWQ